MSSEEEMDMDDRHDRAEEERKENCSHTDVEGSLRVTIHSNPYERKSQEGFMAWAKYLATQGTELFDLYLDICCCDCGSTQENLLDKDEMLELDMVWVE
tara:strand:- start:33 stop:329 length:297 start_codon:yes stop_codon:yes gene_type:complete